MSSPLRSLLVIDDDPDTADTLALLLSREGCECRVAYSGEQGVGMAASWRPEMVIVDLAMPVLDGFQVARRLRAEASAWHPQLVAHTALAGPDEIDDALEAGFDRLLVKPASIDELLALVRGEASDAVAPPLPLHRPLTPPPLSLGAR